LFAIIAIFNHYAFCDVFNKVKFGRKRKAITNVPKPNTMVSKISAMLPEVRGE
jgi:hypothetical protein